MTIEYDFVHVKTGHRGGSFSSPYVRLDLKWKQGRLNSHALKLLGRKKTHIHLLWAKKSGVVGMIPGTGNLPNSSKISSATRTIGSGGQFSIGRLLKDHPEVKEIIEKLERDQFPVIKTDFEIPGEYEGETVYAIHLQ